jgi:hypothetical protein
MVQKVERFAAWIAIPVLAIASVFDYLAGGFGPLLSLAICAGGATLSGRAFSDQAIFPGERVRRGDGCIRALPAGD